MTEGVVPTHLAVLVNPLKYVWGFLLDPRSVQFLDCGLFHQNPPSRTESPFLVSGKGFKIPFFH